MKPTIVHFVQDLSRGGAETMLISVIKELKGYKNIIVTIGDKNEFKDELQNIDHYSLHSVPFFSRLPWQAFRFRRLLKKTKPNIVHSHLPFPNFIARLAVPKSIPLVTTLHTAISYGYNRKLLFWIDRWTLRLKPSTLIGCSNFVLQDYQNSLNLKLNNSIVIQNPIKTSEYTIKENYNSKVKFRLICVASLKKAKNILYLVRSLSKLKRENIELHIFGDGPLHEEILSEINELKAPVFLHGVQQNIPDILKDYDLFVMSSFYEGLSIAVLEAMSARMPLLLSDIPSFREEAADAAIFFDLADQDDFIKKVRFLKSNTEYRTQLALKGFERVNKKFSVENYLISLNNIYRNLL